MSNVVNAIQVKTETEYKRLLALIRKPPKALYSEVVTFTPELCELLLEHHGQGNRRVRSAIVARYAESMKSKEGWTLTGETVVLSDRSLLRNGHHRFAACIRAGVAFTSLVVFGVEDDAYSFMDSGAKRTSGDVFSTAGIEYAGITAGAIRWIRLLLTDPQARGLTFVAHDLLVDYQKMSKVEQDALKHWASEAYAISRGSKLPPASLTALLYLMARKDKLQTERFASDLRARKGNAKVLLVKCQRIHEQRMGRVEESQRNALTIICWNSYADGGKRLTLDRLAWTEAQPFPAI